MSYFGLVIDAVGDDVQTFKANNFNLAISQVKTIINGNHQLCGKIRAQDPLGVYPVCEVSIKNVQGLKLIQSGQGI